jgi:hypothetical protein
MSKDDGELRKKFDQDAEESLAPPPERDPGKLG